MGDHDSPSSCLSSDPHDSNIRDEYLHYAGCLREHQRENVTESNRQEYFDKLDDVKKNRIRQEEGRIRKLRALFESAEIPQSQLTLEFNTSLKAWREELRANKPEIQLGNQDEERGTSDSHDIPTKENAFCMDAYAMFFEHCNPHDDKSYFDKIRNQKIPIKTLLFNKDSSKNPLMEECKKDELRYFHFPGNNMDWIEEAFARYFNGERPEYDGLFERPDITRSKTDMLLRPQFWRGQLHGGRNDPVYARHMRPRCDIVSSNPENIAEPPKNIVLFMPYLHWETSHRREHFDEVMHRITVKHKKAVAKKEAARFKCAPEKTNAAGNNELALLMHTMSEVVTPAMEAEGKSNSKGGLAKREYGAASKKRRLEPCKALGRTLYQAAKLSEAMNYFHEEKFLEEYLHHNPPFHPRRTLDQSYYWTLRSTKRRDTDQVVYRGTAPKKGRGGIETDKKTKKEKNPPAICRCAPTDTESCIHDRANSRMLARVVMCDQLWMWVLDDNTIITSFPKRYGRNKPDPSAVHKGIRLRLKSTRSYEVRSIYDLALIILDECSKVFFDRTKSADRKPQVMDLFATAIGDVSNKQTIAYDHFWHTTKKVSKLYTSKDSLGDYDQTAKTLLDINPEGILLREIKDIQDELNLMLNIKTKQQKIFKDFSKHVKMLIARPSAVAEELGLAKKETVTGNTYNNEHGLELNDSGKESIDSDKRAEGMRREADAKWTLQFAHDLSAQLDDRVADLHSLQEAAGHTEKALDGLLTLKQQQAGVVQAREAVRQAEEALRQGRSIMLLTVTTIIFLPLSFGSSVFGMNNAELGDNSMHLSNQIKWMVIISLAVVGTAFVLAFSSWIRALISFSFEWTWTKFTTSTGLYVWWFGLNQNSAKFRKKKRGMIAKMKENARLCELEKQDKKKQEKRAVENNQSLENSGPIQSKAKGGLFRRIARHASKEDGRANTMSGALKPGNTDDIELGELGRGCR